MCLDSRSWDDVGKAKVWERPGGAGWGCEKRQREGQER